MDHISKLRASSKRSGRLGVPTVWWRESTPQHFHTPDGLFKYKRSWEKNASCLQSVPKPSSGSNLVNDRINPIVTAAAVPILQVWGAGRNYGGDHIANAGSAIRKKRMFDCTHFCEPS